MKLLKEDSAGKNTAQEQDPKKTKGRGKLKDH